MEVKDISVSESSDCILMVLNSVGTSESNTVLFIITCLIITIFISRWVLKLIIIKKIVKICI